MLQELWNALSSTSLPDQMRLAAEFQIMDAGWSVKLQRMLPAARLRLFALRFFA
jgi:hypothetical protein